MDVQRWLRKQLREASPDLLRAMAPEVRASADIVITMGRSVGAVEIPETVRHLDWRIGDPAGADVDEVRCVRDDIERRIAAFVRDVLPEPAAAPAARL